MTFTPCLRALAVIFLIFAACRQENLEQAARRGCTAFGASRLRSASASSIREATELAELKAGECLLLEAGTRFSAKLEDGVTKVDLSTESQLAGLQSARVEQVGPYQVATQSCAATPQSPKNALKIHFFCEPDVVGLEINHKLTEACTKRMQSSGKSQVDGLLMLETIKLHRGEHPQAEGLLLVEFNQ